MWQKIRENKSLQGTLLASPALLWMIVLLIIPLLLVVITSFGGRDVDGNVVYKFSLDNYIRLTGYSATEACGIGAAAVPPPCFNDLYANILWRSVVLAFETTAIVIVMGYPLAYFVARAAPRRRNLLLFLVLIPLWTNFVIRVYAWIIILRGEGVLNNVLEWITQVLPFLGPFHPADMLYTQGAVLVGMVYEFLPFMILPLSMPGVVAGTILVFVPVMGTFVVSDILGGRQVVLVGNLIQQQFLSARDPAFGSAASIVLMALTLVVTVFYTRRFGFGEEVASA